MRVTTFLAGRGVERQAVLKYMQRHPELFGGHIKKNGKEYELDAAAVRLLEEKYPLPAPVQIIQGIDPVEYERVQDERAAALRELADAQNRENALIAQIADAREKYSALLIKSKADQEQAVADAVKAKEDELSMIHRTEIRQLLERQQEELKDAQERYQTKLEEAEKRHSAELDAERSKLEAERSKSVFTIIKERIFKK